MAGRDTVAAPAGRGRTALITGGTCHFFHDGIMDTLYVLLPLWKFAFGLSLVQVGLLTTVYMAAMASFQIPFGVLAERLGERLLLCAGTAVTALAYAGLGLAGGFSALAAILLVAGFFSGVQHPLASSLISGTYDRGGRRMALGIYNFTGDAGKVALPALVALVIATGDEWRWATVGLGALGLALAAAVYVALGRAGLGQRTSRPPAAGLGAGRWGITDRRGFGILSAVGMIDTLVRLAFLTFLPFLLIAKGMAVETVGLALGLVFAGGAAGKFLCGAIAEKSGVIATVLLTEILTGGGVLLLLALPLQPLLFFLPLLGAAMNGTSSVLYGTIADFVEAERQGRAFGLFYTLSIATASAGPAVFGAVSDATNVMVAIAGIGALALTTVPLAWLLRPSVARALKAVP